VAPAAFVGAAAGVLVGGTGAAGLLLGAALGLATALVVLRVTAQGLVGDLAALLMQGNGRHARQPSRRSSWDQPVKR
jgi:hypothetical protein